MWGHRTITIKHPILRHHMLELPKYVITVPDALTGTSGTLGIHQRGCSRRGQWMGVVLYNKTAYDIM